MRDLGASAEQLRDDEHSVRRRSSKSFEQGFLGTVVKPGFTLSVSDSRQTQTAWVKWPVVTTSSRSSKEEAESQIMLNIFTSIY